MESEQSDIRAHQIATYAAEDLVRSKGEPTGTPNEFLFAYHEIDEHTLECINHLVWAGEAMRWEVDDDSIAVLLLDVL